MTKLNERNKYNLFIWIILIFEVIYLISSMHLSFNIDEEFTMGLVNHSYSGLLKINALDVHPPLYYLLLKVFLSCTTFWSNSLFVKIFFARIFSLIFFILSLIYLNKILKLIDVKSNIYSNIILFCIMPLIIKYAVYIRMYEFITFAIVAEFYYLLKMSYLKRNSYLISAVIFALVASYSYYFSAISSGLLLLLFFFHYVINRNFRSLMRMLIAGCSFLLLYSPIFIYLHKQIINRQNYPMLSNSAQLKSIFASFSQVRVGTGVVKYSICLIISCIYIYLIFWSKRNMKKEFNYVLFYSLSDYIMSIFIFLIISIGFKINVFEMQATYPIYVMYVFFLIISLKKIICMNNTNLLNRIITIFLLLLFIIFMGGSIRYNYINYDLPSRIVSRKLNRINNCKSANINLYSNRGSMRNSLYLIQLSEGIHNKEISLNHKEYNNLRGVCNGNNKLFKELFTNIKCGKY